MRSGYKPPLAKAAQVWEPTVKTSYADDAVLKHAAKVWRRQRKGKDMAELRITVSEL